MNLIARTALEEERDRLIQKAADAENQIRAAIYARQEAEGIRDITREKILALDQELR